MLAEPLAGIEPVRGDRLAQRRQAGDAVRGRPRSMSAVAAAPRHVVGHREGRDQARRIGAAGAGDVERGAVIGRGADEGQAERDVDAAREVDGLDRDQRLVVIHAERRIVGRARGRMKQRVGRRGAAHLDAVRAQSLDGRCDHAAFLVAHGALLAGMRIECGDGKARARDAEQRLQAGRGDAAHAHDRLRVEGPDRLRQRKMDGDRHDAQLRAGQHHRDLDRMVGGARCELGQELGMAGMREARVLQRLFLDRIGGEARDLAGERQRDGAFDGLDRGRRIGGIGMAGPDRRPQAHRQDRQRRGKDAARLGRMGDLLAGERRRRSRARARQAGRDRRETKNGRACRAPAKPGLEGQFAADAGRLAHRDGERRGRGHGLISMVAARLNSRM